jgi:3-hydroxyisobutyrate dehydrogenase-like beta-hydroxyacid dehydrogenase
MANLGFIGLGRMGLHMARNLIKAGHSVTLYNRSQTAVQQLVSEGGRAAISPADVARAARILFTCLTTPEVVESVIRQALEGAQAGDIFVDHSTIGVDDAKRIAEICAAKNVHFIDAPISGGPPGAEAGTLTIMCGGDPQVYDRVLPFLQIEGKQLHLLGPVGSGTVAKLCNQLLVGVHTAAMAEAYVLGVKAGLDPEQLHQINQSSAQGRLASRQFG